MMADVIADVVGFGRALRAAGLMVGIGQLETFACALELIPRLCRRDVYLAARATLVSRRDDLAVFEDTFAHWFDAGARTAAARKMPTAPRHDRAHVHTALGSFMAEKAAAADPEIAVSDQVKTASHMERLQRKDFARCSDAEREEIARMMRSLRLQLTLRRSLRRVRARRGPHLDLAAILRSWLRRGGAIVELPRRRRKLKRRPLVVLADISGSMELYSRLLLQFLHAVSHQHRSTETFVFGTRITRITGQLQVRDLDVALDRAGAQISDYAGGTRIGDCLRVFNRSHARRVLQRGAVVLVISDGLDTGVPAALAAEVAALRGRSHRLIWLNPLLGGTGYQPITGGMAAALPHIDDFLPVRNLASLQVLARHLARVSRQRREIHREYQGAWR
jgi:uncharacterized protein